MRGARGDDLWKHEHAGVLIRSQPGTEDERAAGAPERLAKLEPERLQEAMDRAAIAFSDPTRPATRSFPDGSPPKSTFPPKRSRRT